MITKTYNYLNFAKSLIRDMFENESNKLNSVVEENDNGIPAHRCIHLEIGRFIETITEIDGIKPLFGKKFLDVGCGIGQKVYIASVLGMEAFGLELRNIYAEKARELFSRYRNKNLNKYIIQGNAVDFNNYSMFDLIYFYRPSPDVITQQKIELSILKKAKKGTILIGYLSEFLNHDNCAEPSYYGWKKNYVDRNIIYWEKISDKPQKITTREIDKSIGRIRLSNGESYFYSSLVKNAYYKSKTFNFKENKRDETFTMKQICEINNLPYKDLKWIQED